MAIFQPTNILPDMLAGNGSGTVFYDPNDLSAQAEISWKVNGNSPMTAYRIRFYTNNAASTNVHTTGKVTVSPAFSAVSADGSETRFSVKVPIAFLTDCADSTTGYTGKFEITQWWGSAGDSERVIQRSLTVFRVNGITEVSVGFDTDPGYGGVYNFKATVTAPVPDHFDTSLVWTRWQLQRTDGKDIQDTGRVWGATEYKWTSRQVCPGYYYELVFTAMTSTGQYLESTPFYFDYDGAGEIVSIKGAVTAECEPHIGAVNVRIRYNGIIKGYIHAGGPASTDFSPYVNFNGFVVLPSGATAQWILPAELSASKWGFYWAGKPPVTGDVVTITQADGTDVGIYMNSGSVYFRPGNVFGGNISPLLTKIYFTFTNGTGANASKWYLNVGWGSTYNMYTWEIPGYTQESPVSVIFAENTTTEECRIIYGSQDTLAACVASGDDIDTNVHEPQIVIPYADDQTYAYAGLASVEYFGSNISNQGAVYRTVNGGPLEFVSMLRAPSLNEEAWIVDYGVANDNTYRYYVVNQYDRESTAILLKSNPVVPCKWEWRLLEVAPDGVYGDYSLVNYFAFSMNVSSGQDGNGAAPGVYNNFTRYPVVMKDTVNRHSGTLSGLIGYLAGPGEYRDLNSQRDALRALSTTNNPLFLRSRRGDFFRIAISGEIMTSVEDNSPKQQITASVPWVEVGPAEGSIVSTSLHPIDPPEIPVTPAKVIAAAALMTPVQKVAMRAEIGATDQTTGLADDIKLAILSALGRTAYSDTEGMGKFNALLNAFYPSDGGGAS